MKHLLLIISLLSLSSGASAQYAFYRLYGGDLFDYGYDIAELPDSGFFVTGMTGSFTPGHSQAFLMRLDKNGNKLWSIGYGGIENDAAKDIEYKENFGTYMSGRTTSQNGDFDVWISLLDDQGGVIWERDYFGPDWEEAVEAEMTQDDGLMVAVHRYGSGTINQDASLIRFDPQGDTVWVQDFSSAGDDEITKIARHQDSLFVVTSVHFDTLTSTDYTLLSMIHENGSLLWDDTIGIYPGNSYLNDFYLEGDTLFGVGAHKLDDTSTYNRMRHRHRLSLAENGDIATAISVSAGNLVDDVITPAYGLGLIYTSFRFEDIASSNPNDDFYLAHSTIDLNPLGQGAFTLTDGDDRLHEAIPTLDSGAVFVGLQALSSGGHAVVITKIAKDFDYPLIPENPFLFSIADVSEVQPILSANVFPNPTSDILHILTDGEEVGHYSLVNLEGKELVSGNISNAETLISVEGISSGMYFLQFYNEGVHLGSKQIAVQ